jgi:hypothetical protein
LSFLPGDYKGTPTNARLGGIVATISQGASKNAPTEIPRKHWLKTVPQFREIPVGKALNPLVLRVLHGTGSPLRAVTAFE